MLYMNLSKILKIIHFKLKFNWPNLDTSIIYFLGIFCHESYITHFNSDKGFYTSFYT